MRLCLVSGNTSTRKVVREQCEPEIQIDAVGLHEIMENGLPPEREREVIEHLSTADGLLFEWDVLHSHLIGMAQNRASYVGIPVIALCPDDSQAYATALLAGADAATSHPVDPVVLKSMVVAHRRTLQTAHDVAAILADVDRRPGEADDVADKNRPSENGTPSYRNEKPYQMVLFGQRLDLSSQQHDLLAFLKEHANETVSRDKILDAVWGMDFNPGTNVVDVAVHYLRKALSEYGLDQHLETVRGKGYRLSLPTGKRV